MGHAGKAMREEFPEVKEHGQLSYHFRFSPSNSASGYHSNPRASSGSVALPWVITVPPSPWQFSWRLCKSTFIQVNGLVFQTHCKRLQFSKLVSFGGVGERKKKVGPFLIRDKGNAQECSQCWSEIMGGYFPISKPL